MRFTRFFLLCGFVLLAMPQSSLLGNEISVRHELEEDEWLFVEGKEYRYLDVFFEPKKREVFVNSHLVFSEAATRVEQPDGPPGVSTSDSLFSRVPMVIDFVSKGGTEDEAIVLYINKVSGLFLWLKEQTDFLKEKEISLSELQDSLEQKLDTKEYQGCMEEVQVFSDGSVLWKPFSAANHTSVIWTKNKNINPQKSGHQFVSEYISLFESGGKVVVVGFGVVSVDGGTTGKFRLLKQLRSIEKSKTYIPGPFSERQSKIFGFQIEGKNNGKNK